MSERAKFLITTGLLFYFLFISSIQVLYSQDDAVAWFNRGAKAQGAQEKITCYLKAIELNSKFTEAYYNLGYVYKNQGDLNNAEKAFQQALLSNPAKINSKDKLRITYELGITLKKLNRYNDAITTLESAKNLARQKEIRAAVLYELGRTKLLIGNFDGALAEFSEGLMLNSSRQDAFESAVQNARMLRDIENDYVAGSNYLNNGQYDEAINVFTKIVRTSPNYKDALQKLADAQRSKDRQAKVDNLSNIYARGIGYMQREDWENAIIAFKQIEQVKANYKDVTLKLAEVRAKLDQSMQQELYDRIYNEGLQEYQNGNWINAIVSFEKVATWNPKYKNIAQLYQDAQNKLNREGESSIKNRYYVQGKGYLNRGNWESAITSFKQLKNMDANYRDVQFLLQQAQNELEKEAKSNQLDSYYTEGIEFYNNAEWLKAILAFEKIQQIDPNFKDVPEKLVTAQNSLDKPQQVVDASNSIKPDKTKTIRKNGSWMFIGIGLSLLLIPMGIAFLFVPTTRAKWRLIQGNYQQAALIYESVLMKKPKKVKLYPSLANLYLLLNRNDEIARKVFDIALKMDIPSHLRQRLDEATNQQYLPQNDENAVESLEDRLRKELINLKNN